MTTSIHIPFSEPVSAISLSDQAQLLSPANPLPIAPKPPLGLLIVGPDPITESALPTATSPSIERRVHSFSAAREYPTPVGSVAVKSHLDTSFDTIDHSHIPEPIRKPPPQQNTHYDFDALNVKQERGDELLYTPARTSSLDWSSGPISPSLSTPQELFCVPNSQFSASSSSFHSYPTASTWKALTPISASAGPSFHEAQSHDNVDLKQIQSFLAVSKKRREPQFDNKLPASTSSRSYVTQTTDWTAGSERAFAVPLVEDDEEDAFEVCDADVAMKVSECDDGSWQGRAAEKHIHNNDLGIIVALLARKENGDLGLRSVTSFIDRPNMLATYTPSPQSSPLNDSMTARLFCHFINVTGPSMSMFERHPANPSLIFQGQPVPKSQQHIWTCKSQTIE